MMIDSLFARAQLAIEESRQLQDRNRFLGVEIERKREELRIALFETLMYRSEMNAFRDNGN